MARITTEFLDGYAMQVGQLQVQEHDNGMPIFNGSGDPKMVDRWQFVFQWVQADGTTHMVKGPLMDRQSIDDMVASFTGGIRPATLVDLPPGVDLGKL